MTAFRRRIGAASVSLLAALASPPALAQQGPPGTAPAAGAQGAWAETDKKAAEGDAARAREAERMREDELTRRQTQRNMELRAALERDKAALEQPLKLQARLFELPETLKLSAGHRALAEAALKVQRERAAAAWPAWRDAGTERASEGSAQAGTDVQRVAQHLSARVLNEAALWLADAQPHASDALWIAALQRGGVCQGLVGNEPAARIAALIEALPADQRAAAWAGESARLSRWGQATRSVLPPAERTLEDQLLAALQAPALAKTVAAMPQALRAAVQAPGWTPAAQGAAQRCELLRWWSQEQVRLKQLGPRQAMLAWRTALAPRSGDYLLADVPRSGDAALDKGGFPHIAHRLELTGRVVVEQDLDASGKVVRGFVQRRELRAAGLGDQPPLALEHELDAATLQRVAAMPAQAPEPAALRDGVATRRVGIEWVAN